LFSPKQPRKSNFPKRKNEKAENKMKKLLQRKGNVLKRMRRITSNTWQRITTQKLGK